MGNKIFLTQIICKSGANMLQVTMADRAVIQSREDVLPIYLTIDGWQITTSTWIVHGCTMCQAILIAKPTMRAFGFNMIQPSGSWLWKFPYPEDFLPQRPASKKHVPKSMQRWNHEPIANVPEPLHLVDPDPLACHVCAVVPEPVRMPRGHHGKVQIKINEPNQTNVNSQYYNSQCLSPMMIISNVSR